MKNILILKILISLVLSLFQIPCLFAADRSSPTCNQHLTPKDLSEEQWLKVDTLLKDTAWQLKVLNFLVRASGTARNKQDILRGRMLNNLRGYIHRGEVESAIATTHQLFLEVEEAYHKIIRLKNQQQDPSVNIELKTAYKIFGSLFRDYAAVRGYLENKSKREKESIEQGQKTLNIAEIVLKQSSSDQLLPMLPEIAISEMQPSLEAMRKLFATSQEAYKAHLNHYIHSQVWTALKSWTFTQKGLALLRSVVYQLPAQYRDSLSDAIGLSYDTFVRDTYLPYIETIIQSKINVKEKMIHLQEITAATDEDMLVTFARYIAGKDTWDEIKKYAEDHDENFGLRMLTAEDAALKSGGQLSSIYTKSPAEKTAIYAAAFVTLAYLYYQNPDLYKSVWRPIGVVLGLPK